MILEWLTAELKSKRFAYPDQIGGRRSVDLVTDPSLENGSDNAARRDLLTEVRGYSSRTLIFTGFPTKVDWFWASLAHEDLGRLFYLNDEGWVRLTNGTRVVVDGATNIAGTKDAEAVTAIADEYASGNPPPRPIIVEHEDRLIVLEGCLRVTAFVVSNQPGPLQVLLGRSPHMGGWYFV